MEVHLQVRVALEALPVQVLVLEAAGLILSLGIAEIHPWKNTFILRIRRYCIIVTVCIFQKPYEIFRVHILKLNDSCFRLDHVSVDQFIEVFRCGGNCFRMYNELLLLLANAERKQTRLNKASYSLDWTCDDDIVAYFSKQDVEGGSPMVESFTRGCQKELNGNVVKRIGFA